MGIRPLRLTAGPRPIMTQLGSDITDVALGESPDTRKTIALAEAPFYLSPTVNAVDDTLITQLHGCTEIMIEGKRRFTHRQGILNRMVQSDPHLGQISVYAHFSSMSPLCGHAMKRVCHKPPVSG